VIFVNLNLSKMRNIYPKLITALFLILIAAMILKYADAGGSSTDPKSKTAKINKVHR
jgi:hypothetical protein